MRVRYLTLLFCLLITVYLLSQPRWLFTLIEKVWPGALYYVSGEYVSGESVLLASPKVALTIDDGPGPHTVEILALLNRYDAKATFFTISEHLPGYETIVAQVVESGHELGNHLTKDEPSIRLLPEAFEADLLAAESALLPFVGEAGLRWLRPGMGVYTPEMVAIAQKHSYRLALGNNFPYDTHIPSSRFARAFILNTVQPGDIIVLHDGQGQNAARGDRTLKTLSVVLPKLRERGYKVTTLSELVASSK